MISTRSEGLIVSYLSKFYGLSWQIWAGLAAVFTNSLGTTATLFMALYFTSQLHFSVTDSGTLITIFGIGSIFGAYFSGHLCNKYSSHIISILSLVINSITLFMVAISHDFWLLLIIIAIMGVSNSAFIPANRVWLMRQCEEEQKTRVNSLRFMILNIGIGIAVFIGGMFAKFGYMQLFFFNASAVMLSSIILMILGRSEEKIRFQPDSASSESMSKFVFLESRELFFTYIMLLFVSFVFAQLRITYPIYLKDEYHLSTKLFSYLFLVNTIFIVLFQVLIVDYVSKFNQFIVASIGSFTVGFGMFILIFGHTYSLAMGSCLLWTIGEILAFPIIQMLLYNKANESTKAIHMGLYQSVYSLAHVAGPILGSWMYQFQNGLGVWALCGILGLSCLVIGLSEKQQKLN